MDEEFRKALTEVVEVLKNSEDSIIKKIPQEFNNFLNENMDKNYKPNIDFSKSNWEDNVKEDTKASIEISSIVSIKSSVLFLNFTAKFSMSV